MLSMRLLAIKRCLQQNMGVKMEDLLEFRYFALNTEMHWRALRGEMLVKFRHLQPDGALLSQ